MLSNKAKYGLKALIYLAENLDRPIQCAEIAETQNIPKKFLDAILLSLRNQGVLVSRKGRSGGYLLARPPEKIFMSQVIRILDGPLAPVPCVSITAYSRCNDCESEERCRIRPMMLELRNAMLAVLDRKSLAHVLAASDIDALMAYDN
jgi:Rrf2 family protein